MKSCRNALDFDKSQECQESWPKVCDLMLASPNKECSNIAETPQKHENVFGIEESKSKEPEFPRFKETLENTADFTLEKLKTATSIGTEVRILIILNSGITKI